MKHFLYLDIDIINSIIAQAEKGLASNVITESGENSEVLDTDASQNSVTGSAGGNIMKLIKAEADIEHVGTHEKGQKSEKMSKEVITKTLHDASFDMAYSIIETELIKDNVRNCVPGQYIEAGREYSFIDLEYFSGLFSKNGFIDFLKKTEKEKIESAVRASTENLNREQSRNAGKVIKNKVRELAKDSDKQFDDISDVITALKQVIPYEKMLASKDGLLIPTEDKYFRINPKSMGFMYGGGIHCVGMVTNIINKNRTASNNGDVFAELRDAVNEVIQAMLPADDNSLIVIHPIAIYYEA